MHENSAFFITGDESPAGFKSPIKGGILKMSLFLMSFLLISFTTMKSNMIHNNIKKNTKFTQKQVNFLFKKNGNAFYLDSSYATFSIVWTYSKNGIEIYRLVNGKVFKKEIFPEKEWLHDADIAVEEIYKNCSVVLDGDGFGFKINMDGNIHKESYTTNIDCMKQQTFESEFLNKIVNDIKNYKMWEIIL